MHGEFRNDLLAAATIVIPNYPMPVGSDAKFLAVGVRSDEREGDPSRVDSLIGVGQGLLGMTADGINDPRLVGMALTVGVAIQIESVVANVNSVIGNFDRLIFDRFPGRNEKSNAWVWTVAMVRSTSMPDV